MKYICTRSENRIIVELDDGSPCTISQDEYPKEWAEVQAYIIDHPDVVQPEPLSTSPTDAQLEAAAESQRQVLFDEYDLAVKMLSRAERLGDTTAKLAAWDAYAESLRAINDTEGWFRDPQWPVKPEM